MMRGYQVHQQVDAADEITAILDVSRRLAVHRRFRRIEPGLSFSEVPFGRANGLEIGVQALPVGCARAPIEGLGLDHQAIQNASPVT